MGKEEVGNEEWVKWPRTRIDSPGWTYIEPFWLRRLTPTRFGNEFPKHP